MRKLFSNHYLSGRKIRFMRWSRKGYAAFCSIHRHVTIGQVAKGIADASLSKEKGTQSLNNISLLQRVTAETDTGWLEDRVLHPWWEEKLFCLLWMCEQTGGVAACPAEHIYINNVEERHLLFRQQACPSRKVVGAKWQMPFFFLIFRRLCGKNWKKKRYKGRH